MSTTHILSGDSQFSVLTVDESVELQVFSHETGASANLLVRPEDCITLSRALVKAAAEALGVKA